MTRDSFIGIVEGAPEITTMYAELEDAPERCNAEYFYFLSQHSRLLQQLSLSNFTTFSFREPQKYQSLAQQFQPVKLHTLYLLLHILYHASKSSFPSITSTALKMLCQPPHSRKLPSSFLLALLAHQGPRAME